MSSEDPPDPGRAIRTIIVRSLRGVDIGSRRGRGATSKAVDALDRLERIEQRREAFRVAIRLDVAAFVLLVVLSLLCVAGIVWVAVSRGWDGSGGIALLGAVLGGLLRLMSTVRKRNRERLEALAELREGEDADET